MLSQLDLFKFSSSQKLKLAELFCGAGGIGEAAKLACVPGIEIEHLWATDYDKDACATYNENLKPRKIICEDIRKLEFQSLLKYGVIDCLTFGFPCNDFSTVGEQKGMHGSFGALYEYCVAALNIFNPKYFIAENVSGLRSAMMGKLFRTFSMHLKTQEKVTNYFQIFIILKNMEFLKNAIVLLL